MGLTASRNNLSKTTLKEKKWQKMINNQKKLRITEEKMSTVSHPEKLLSNYSVGRIQRKQLLLTGAINQSTLLKTSKGNFVLRVFPSKRSKKWIQNDLALLHCLYLQGLPVQQVIPNNQGKLLSTQNQQHYCLLEFIPGKHVFNPLPQQAKNLAKTISSLHQAMQKCRLPRTAKEKDLFDFSYDQKIIKKLRKQKSPLFKPFKEEVQAIKKQLKKYAKRGIKKGLIHHDLAPYNIVFQGNSVAGILDFDESCEGHLASDLAILLGHFSPKTEKTFLKEYQTNIRLSQAERKFLPVIKRHYGLYLGYWLWNQQHKPKLDKRKIQLYKKFCRQYRFKPKQQNDLEKLLGEA